MAKILHTRGNGPVMINIGLRYLGKHRPTSDEVVRVLETIRDTGRAPKFWQFKFIDWKNPAKYGKGWDNMTRGSENDVAAFRAVINAEIENLKVRLVRKLY